MKYSLLFLFLWPLIQWGCEEKFDIATLPSNKQNVGLPDTTYVEISPPIGGFGSPRAVMVGNDQLIYVADYDNNEIVMLDAGGRVLRRRSIPHPVSIAQNSKLDLYVGGEAPAPNGAGRIGAIYKINLVRFDTTTYDTCVGCGALGRDSIISHFTSTFYNHHLDSAHMHIIWEERDYPARRFPGIAVMPGNDLLVARIGPDNSSSVDPDCRVLQTFNHDDTYLYPVGDLVTRPSGGTGITDIQYLTGIMVFPATRNFILTQTTEGQGVVYGAVAMTYVKNKDRDGWDPTFDPSVPAKCCVDFISANRFSNAVGAAYDRKRNEIFILDAGLDSVVKFNAKGQFRPESFGRGITTTPEFPHGLDQPMGIAFSNDCTLYIADTGNKVVRRFRLSVSICN